jgi:class 3 adenylate cyclase
MEILGEFLKEIEGLSREVRELREKLEELRSLRPSELKKSLAGLSEIGWKVKILEGTTERLLSLAQELKPSFLSQLRSLLNILYPTHEASIAKLAAEALQKTLDAEAVYAFFPEAEPLKFRPEQWLGEAELGEVSEEVTKALRELKPALVAKGFIVPIRSLKGPKGLLYIVTENRGREDLAFAEAVASLVGIGMEIREMAEELDKAFYELARLQAIKEQEELEKDYIRALFSRFVSPQVVEKLASDPSILRLGGVRQEITILFADIRGFTALSEKLPPEELVKTLNQYLSVAADAILEEEGTLDKFLGDAVMAFFNAPFPQKEHVLRGARAALKIKSRLEELHSRNALPLKLYFGIGLNVGEAVIGNIGTSMQMNYTAIGDCVNVAKRLQEIAKPGQILISSAVYERIKEKAFVRTLPPTSIPGKSSREHIYELLGLLE